MNENRAKLIRAAYADLVRLAHAMWPVLLILSAMYFVCVMGWFIAPLLVNTWIGRSILRMLIFVGVAWVLTPYYIALHRFVATGEARWIPSRESYGEASNTYFGWAAVSVCLWFAPIVGGELVDAFLPPSGRVVQVVGFVAVFCILPRLTTLLPTAAIDPGRAGWKQALGDSRGRGWSLFLSTTSASFPAIVALIMAGQAAAARTIEPVPFFVIVVPALLALQVLPLSIATRVYVRAGRHRREESGEVL